MKTLVAPGTCGVIDPDTPATAPIGTRGAPRAATAHVTISMITLICGVVHLFVSDQWNAEALVLVALWSTVVALVGAVAHKDLIVNTTPTVLAATLLAAALGSSYVTVVFGMISVLHGLLAIMGYYRKAQDGVSR